ncbi:MAG: ketoacyl-ACP synthase III [Bacteroidota bacterium]
MQACLTALSSYVPSKRVDNRFFENILDTSDEWIKSRTGITERRFVEEESTTDLCVKAAEAMAAEHNKDLSEVDFIIVASISPDHTMPSMACVVQGRLGITGAGALDISAACAGFVYGLILGQGLIAAGTHKKVLVIGAETISRYLDFEDRTTCILFGDGAGAALLEAGESGDFISSLTGSQGEQGQELYISSMAEQINGVAIEANNKLHQDGRKVFKWAVQTVAKQAKELVDKSPLSIEDIDWLVPHSANMRIIEAICNHLEFPIEKTLNSVHIYGNTSSASIPLALAEGIRTGQLKKGQKILLIGFGGGLTYAGAILEWQI